MILPVLYMLNTLLWAPGVTTVYRTQPKPIAKANTLEVAAPVIMPGVRLNTEFATLPVQEAAVAKAAPDWLRARTTGTPMYVVNGKPATAGQLRTMQQRDVSSINVLNPAKAEALYGRNARNGLVLITTKSVTIPHH